MKDFKVLILVVVEDGLVLHKAAIVDSLYNLS